MINEMINFSTARLHVERRRLLNLVLLGSSSVRTNVDRHVHTRHVACPFLHFGYEADIPGMDSGIGSGMASGVGFVGGIWPSRDQPWALGTETMVL